MQDTNPPGSALSDPSFSLTHSLHEVARGAGLDIDFDDLHATMGLPLMTCAVRDQPRVDLWLLCARDAFVVPAARLFGMIIRELHPPEAARGLDHAPEFGQHFCASYLPLVERALENNQLVLAWQGWPGECEHMWGIITGRCESGVGLVGRIVRPPTASASTSDLRLVTPPLQLYVVEAMTPAPASAEELLSVALDHARSALNNEVGERFGAVTGPGAYDEWIGRLSQDDAGRADDHRRLAASLIANHESMIRFLRRSPPGDTPGENMGVPDSKVINELTSACGTIVSELTTLAKGTPPDEHLVRSEARKEFISQIERTREATLQVRDAINATDSPTLPAE
ncbi:MAG: hypothetical protein JSU63_15040 [Phycisphaerales bacterium]|nr:MAG: hypothetical protein JSU63_15040 [Phycisphaerales bacterium]